MKYLTFTKHEKILISILLTIVIVCTAIVIGLTIWTNVTPNGKAFAKAKEIEHAQFVKEHTYTYPVEGIKQHTFTETQTNGWGGVTNQEFKIIYQFSYQKDDKIILVNDFEVNYYNDIVITNKDQSYFEITNTGSSPAKTLYITQEDWNNL